MENVNRTGDFFSPLPGVRGFCGVPRGRFSFFRGHGGCRFPAGCAPHSLPRGENPPEGLLLPLRGNSPPASRPVEERRQGNPFDGVPLDPSATTQRGGTRVSPLFGNTLPGGREQATPQPRPQAVPTPLLRKGGIPRKYLTSDRRVPIYPQQPGCGSKKRRTGHPGGSPTSATAIRG